MSDAEPLTAIEDNMTSAQAELARLHLEEAGIPAYLEGENANAALGMVEQVRLMVPAAMAADATKILAERKPSPLNAPSACLACGQPMPETQATCSACGWTYQE